MYNILVCDDEKDIVSALKIYLTADGYQVFEAYNGKEAIKMIQEEEIHLALMDIMMPEMDGITAMTKIREFSNLPVILLTAKSEDTDKILGLTVGADDYITKPFNPVEVQARVKSQLRRYMQLGGGNVFLLYTVIVWASVLISAFIDNIPYVATMIPVIASLSIQLSTQMGIAATLVATPLYFGLLSGATLGGNCTPIGASANITGIGILRRAGYEVKNSDFFRIGIPFTLAAIVPTYILLWLFYGI